MREKSHPLTWNEKRGHGEISMEHFSPSTITEMMALIGTLILIAGLLSGIIDRTGLPQVAVFLALGVTIGPLGLNLFNVTLDSPLLRIVATLSLILVLFTDAVSLKLGEIRRHLTLVFLVLGPGTLLSAMLISFAGWWLLNLSVPEAAILGAALASTALYIYPLWALIDMVGFFSP